MTLAHRWVEQANGELLPRLGGETGMWGPQEGSQDAFLGCPLTELLYEGNRGPGKTDALLADFLKDVGVGWGPDWVGVLFRKTYPELQDVIAKSRKWFKAYMREASFNEANSTWHFPAGERLLLRQFAKDSDYWKYHGHAYPWIGWEELCTWASDGCFKSMFSCSRSARMGMPRKIRATANPYGVGHNWVKMRYRLPVPPGRVIGPVIRDSLDYSGNPEPPRAAVHGQLSENRILLRADPDYIVRLRAAARNPAELAAWVDGSWDIVAGGMLDDVWARARDRAVVRPFEIPADWKIDRAMDWGQSRPSSVGFWAQSDGSDYRDHAGRRRSTVRGDVFRVGEIYTWNGRPNEGTRETPTELAARVVRLELQRGWRDTEGTIVRAGPADTSIFDPTATGPAIADDMAKAVRLDDGRTYRGPRFVEADKTRGSRKQGWTLLRERLANVLPKEGMRAREHPGLFVWDTCAQWLRTVPVLPRDEKDPDDVDTEAEDHCGDETRYRVRASAGMRQGTTEGV